MDKRDRIPILFLSGVVLVITLVLAAVLLRAPAGPNQLLVGTMGLGALEDKRWPSPVDESGDPRQPAWLFNAWIDSDWAFILQEQGYQISFSTEPQFEARNWTVDAVNPGGGILAAQGATPNQALGNLVAGIVQKMAAYRDTPEVWEPRPAYGRAESGVIEEEEAAGDNYRVGHDWLLILQQNGYRLDFKGPAVHTLMRGRWANPRLEEEFEVGGDNEREIYFHGRGRTLDEALGRMISQITANYRFSDPN